MDSRADTSLRLLRTLVLGGVVLALGVVAHVAGGGLLPSWPVLAGLVLACAGAGWTFLRCRVSGPVLVALTVGGQAMVHLALTVTAGHTGDSGTSPGGVLPLLSGIGSDLVHHTLDEPLMLLAHLAAAVLVGLWLGRGERLLWSLVALVVALALGTLLRLPGRLAPVVRHAPRPVRRTTRVARPGLARFCADVTRRGPPQLLAA